MAWRRTTFLLLAWLACGGCSATIVPPPTTVTTASGAATPVSLAPVFVADYGYHSTLILPRPNGGGMVEYAYGDWSYFGHNQKSVGNALHALFASDQATLGRRLLYREPDQSGLLEALGAEKVIRFDAPVDRVEALDRALDQRFSARLDSIVYSPVHQLYFVKDDEPYGVGHNCNHFTAQWLERLGCKVEGFVLTSRFTVKGEASPQVVPPPPAPPIRTEAGVARRVTTPAAATQTRPTRTLANN